jgi:hypothetical protein
LHARAPIKNDAEVLIEGILGDIEEIGIIEGLMLRAPQFPENYLSS